MIFRPIVKWLMVALVLSSFALAQTNDEIPEDARVSKVRVAMFGDVIIVEGEKEGILDEVWLQCARAPHLKPEGAHEYMAVQSRNFVRERVVGKDVAIVYDNLKNTPRLDNEGRYMAFVYYTWKPDEESPEELRLLNADLIAAGLARVDTIQPCSKRLQMYELQRSARREQRGLWLAPPQ